MHNHVFIQTLEDRGIVWETCLKMSFNADCGSEFKCSKFEIAILQLEKLICN